MNMNVKNSISVLLLSAAFTAAAYSIAYADDTNDNGWKGSDVNGWYYYEGGIPATGWKWIDDAYYYFDMDGLMAQDELIYLSGETYYLTPSGTMAQGWQSFPDESDILYNYGIDIHSYIEKIQNPVFKTKEEAYKTVWMYFHEDGTAADNEWLQNENGAWNYFEDFIMVNADFDHIIEGARYGFDEHGNMITGWTKNYNNQSILAPNKSSSTWYYYEADGRKFNVDSEPNQFGWKNIDGNWYCFKSELNLESGASVGTLIVDTYFNNGAAADTNADYFYVDKDGIMTTGVTAVNKDAIYIDNRDDWSAASSQKISDFINEDWDILFDENGKAKAGVFENNRYYADINDAKVNYFNTADYSLSPYSSRTISRLKGALVKGAFIEKDTRMYYVDKYGQKVTSHALQIGFVTETVTETGTAYTFSRTSTGAANEYKAYAVFDNKGAAHDGVTSGRTVSAGSKRYISTGLDYSTQGGAAHTTIFFYK